MSKLQARFYRRPKGNQSFDSLKTKTSCITLYSHLCRTHQFGTFTDALLYIGALLFCDGGMHGRTLVRHQDPEHVPNEPETP